MNLQENINLLAEHCLYVLKNSLEVSHREFFKSSLAELLGILKALYFTKQLNKFDLSLVKDLVKAGNKTMNGDIPAINEILFENSLK